MDAVPDDMLGEEGRIFGRYLVGRVPDASSVDRYVAANRVLFPAPPSAEDAAVLAFVRRHPWSVGWLDGAAGLLRPGGLVRSKILLMAAILETTPEFADEFLPRQIGPVALVARLAAAGTVAVLHALGGAILLRALARRAT